jgi:hypothetical protein
VSVMDIQFTPVMPDEADGYFGVHAVVVYDGVAKSLFTLDLSGAVDAHHTVRRSRRWKRYTG